MIVVTLNFRLNVFGFLASEDLAKEQGGHAGNYGLMDIVAALQWVKTNIASFGGNENNVTIFGQSSGSLLLSVHSSRRLFSTRTLSKGYWRKRGCFSLRERHSDGCR